MFLDISSLLVLLSVVFFASLAFSMIFEMLFAIVRNLRYWVGFGMKVLSLIESSKVIFCTI